VYIYTHMYIVIYIHTYMIALPIVYHVALLKVAVVKGVVESATTVLLRASYC
jgi:hypothetical protein